MKKPEDLSCEMLNSVNFNYHRLVSLDLKIAGNELLEICIYPLNHRHELAKSILPFWTLIKPVKSPYYMKREDYKKLRVNEKYYLKAFNEGIPKTQAFDIFEQWVEKKINLLEGRKLMPVCYDWATKKQQLINWAGPLNFDHYFYFHVRDILSLALFANDFAVKSVQRPPYPKVDFGYICSQIGVEHSSNDCLMNAVAIAKIYGIMLHSWYGHVAAWTRTRGPVDSDLIDEDEEEE